MQIRFDREEWHSASPDFRRRFLRTAVRDLGILVAAAVCLELVLRLAVPSTSNILFNAEMTGGHARIKNAYGLRDVEFPRERPAGQTRIVCLGDSTTYGSGVGLEKTYPKQLQDLLSKDGDFFVVNAGGEGTSLAKAARFLDRDGYAFDPKVVIVGFSATMVATTSQKGEGGLEAEPPKPKRLDPKQLLLTAHNKLSSSYLYTSWDNQVRKRLYRFGVLRDQLDKKSGGTYAFAFDVPNSNRAQVEAIYEIIGGQIAELKARLAERGIELIVVGSPARFQLSREAEDNERSYPLSHIRIVPTEHMGRILEERGVRYIDLLPRFVEERQRMLNKEIPYDPLFIEGDAFHFNERGYHIEAEELRQALRDCCKL